MKIPRVLGHHLLLETIWLLYPVVLDTTSANSMPICCVQFLFLEVNKVFRFNELCCSRLHISLTIPTAVLLLDSVKEVMKRTKEKLTAACRLFYSVGLLITERRRLISPDGRRTCDREREAQPNQKELKSESYKSL